MEIKLNTNVDSMARIAGASPRPRNGGSAEDGVSFKNAEALNHALREVPAVRADVVERARSRVADASYPPPETLRKIAHLLAMTIDPQEDTRTL